MVGTEIGGVITGWLDRENQENRAQHRVVSQLCTK